MTHQDLIQKAIAVVQEPDETTIKRFLQTRATLPEPEDELDAALRRMLVDMTVKEYLGTCNCAKPIDKRFK